jgi:hypothetical protein
MAATSLVGSISAFAAIAHPTATELRDAKAITIGQKVEWTKTAEGKDEVVYSFTTPKSKNETDEFVFNFVNEAHVKDAATGERDDSEAFVEVYSYDAKTQTASLEYTIDAVEKYNDCVYLKEYVGKDGSVKEEAKTLVTTDRSYSANLKPETEYLFKVKSYGTYTVKEKNAVTGKEEDKTYDAKVALTITNPETDEFAYGIINNGTVTKPSTEAEIKAATDSRGGYYRVTTKDMTCWVVYQGDASDIVIPDEYKGFKVTTVYGISDSTPESRISSVTLGKNVTFVGGFSDCVRMTKLVLNEGLEEIDNYAFEGCSSLTGELVIPASVKTIGKEAFYNTGYSSAVIKGEDTKIGAMAIGYEDVPNEATATPWDTYSAPKEGFFMTAPAANKDATAYASKFAVTAVDPANCTHVFEQTATKAATIYAKGSKTYTCKVCGTVKTEAIAQKKVAIKSVKSTKKGAITVKTKAVTDKVTAYKVQYATKKDFSNAKTVTVKTTKKALSKTFTGLKAGKKYYVRVKAVNGSKKSAFTATKTVTVKK